ncbi:MAG: DNA-formamidopyrimidine glycosylase [Coleofasciculus sp. S288]|nr:DNA-formamidopyrimidine glycosylase [Coleofasciculus sp. S288]
MPELPEVETVCRGLNQVTLNQEIWGGDVLLSRTIAYPFSVGEFLAGLKNVTIAAWHRRGKYLLAQLAKSDTSSQEDFTSQNSELRRKDPSPLHVGKNNPKSPDAGLLGVHLRMTGQLLWLDREQPLQKHTRVRLFFPNSRELRFVDQRTFGQMWWVPPSETPENIITGLKKLGPDPFSADFSVEYVIEKLYKRQRAIKTALLDQSLVAGVGNIYADEALFLSGIRPETLCAALNREQIERIRTNLIQVLQASIEAGGTTFSNFLSVMGVNGNYSGVAWVYGRTGTPCRVCGTEIRRLKLAGRSSHFCPNCQI